MTPKIVDLWTSLNIYLRYGNNCVGVGNIFCFYENGKFQNLRTENEIISINNTYLSAFFA